MHNMCKCQQYDDLNLVQEEMINREWAYEEIVSDLKQKCQKLVERWLEHYRLYQCSECGQFWQSSICIRGRFDTPKLLYKVPPIKTSEWKTKPYVAPDCILIFRQQQAEFLSKKFEFSEHSCKVEACESKAIKSLNYCQYHQFLQLAESDATWPKPSGRWFTPYVPELLLP